MKKMTESFQKIAFILVRKIVYNKAIYGGLFWRFRHTK